jgi:type I restriction enzyme S subunit
MKTGWETTQLSTVAAVQSGAGFPDRYQNQPDGDIPFYKVSDMNLAGNEREMVCENNTITEETRRELGAFLFPQGSTIFPKIGGAIATNKKRLTTRDCCVDNNVMGVIPKPGKINSDFLFYFFLGHDLSEFANEAHLPSIKKTVVEAWPISVPLLPEQQRIVALLDEAFAGLTTAKANAERNLRNARALFESRLQAVFTQHCTGWADHQLGDLIEIQNGYAFKSDEYSDDGYFVIRISNVQDGEITLANPRFVKLADKKLERFILNAGDILISLTGHIGRVGIIQKDQLPAVLNQRVARITMKNQDACRDFLFRFLLSRAFRESLQDAGRGSAQQNVSTKEIESVRLSLPSINEQRLLTEDFDNYAAETQHLTRLYERKLAALEELKKSLLHQAFNGEL